MAYYYIAEVNLTYLVKKFNKGNSSETATNILRFVILFMTAYGCIKSAAPCMGNGGPWCRTYGMAKFNSYSSFYLI